MKSKVRLRNELQIGIMRVLFEGSFLGKRKYISIGNSSYVLNEPAGKKRKKKHQKTEILPAVEVPNILPYKTLMAFLKTVNIGEVKDLRTLDTELSEESVPGVYRPLKYFLLQLTDLHVDLHKETPML